MPYGMPCWILTQVSQRFIACSLSTLRVLISYHSVLGSRATQGLTAKPDVSISGSGVELRTKSFPQASTLELVTTAAGVFARLKMYSSILHVSIYSSTLTTKYDYNQSPPHYVPFPSPTPS